MWTALHVWQHCRYMNNNRLSNDHGTPPPPRFTSWKICRHPSSTRPSSRATVAPVSAYDSLSTSAAHPRAGMEHAMHRYRTCAVGFPMHSCSWSASRNGSMSRLHLPDYPSAPLHQQVPTARNSKSWQNSARALAPVCRAELRQRCSGQRAATPVLQVATLHAEVGASSTRPLTSRVCSQRPHPLPPFPPTEG